MCPKCTRTMQGIGDTGGCRHWWCPYCGTLKSVQKDFERVESPRLERVAFEQIDLNEVRGMAVEVYRQVLDAKMRGEIPVTRIEVTDQTGAVVGTVDPRML